MNGIKSFTWFLAAMLFPPVCLFAQNPGKRLYEIHNSTSTPVIYKQILRQHMDRRERTDKLRANARLAKAADLVFKLGRVYAVPNPAVGVKHPVIHIEAGLADKIEIKIYDFAGKLIEEAVLIEPPALIKGVCSYEYKFMSEDTPNGACNYTVKAYKNGKQPLEAAGRLIFVKMGN